MAIKICPLADLKPGKAIRVKVGEHAIAIVRTPSGEVKALDDKCSHGEISLSEGFVEEGTIECWAHGAKYDLNTGVPLSLPAYETVNTYEILIENDEIYLEYEN